MLSSHDVIPVLLIGQVASVCHHMAADLFALNNQRQGFAVKTLLKAQQASEPALLKRHQCEHGKPPKFLLCLTEQRIVFRQQSQWSAGLVDLVNPLALLHS